MSNVNAAELVCRMRATDEPVEENVTNIIRQVSGNINLFLLRVEIETNLQAIVGSADIRHF